ncbi:transcriptional regulator NarL [Proteus mirabilis]|uniref:Transcriptional regulator NarL n=1 Tax=Proteus mirabilis TaxID=584 RepID=A0A379FJU5_PROMI|nr:transcriptional regulator NarL [Proteus mirabilis]
MNNMGAVADKATILLIDDSPDVTQWCETTFKS